MKKLTGVAMALFAAFSVNSFAAPVALVGDYVKAGVNDVGTLGSGYTTSPGILYDKTGTQNFGVNDYLTPGTPWEGFSVKSDQTGLQTNNNAGYSDISTVSGPTDTSSGSTNSATWSGQYSDYFTISHAYSFADNAERINISTVITATQDLTGVSFLRTLDPDPDVNTFGTYFTENNRGNLIAGLSEDDWVHALGLNTGLPIALYTTSSLEHNTGISSAWSLDPEFYLAGNNDGDGDYTIGLAFYLGSILKGESITLDYAYVMGKSLGTVDVGRVPLPGAVWLFGSALVGLIGLRKRASA